MLVAKPDKNIPEPNITPPTKRTILGPNLSLNHPPDIIVMGPTELAMVYTIARSPVVMFIPLI